MSSTESKSLMALPEFKHTLIQNCLWKSKQALEEGFRDERKSLVLNRLYYAIFYSVMALGYSDEFVTSRHLQLMNWFRRRYINENKIFDSRMSDIYKTAIAHRQEYDYNFDRVTPITMEQLYNLINDVEYFVNEVESYLTSRVMQN